MEYVVGIDQGTSSTRASIFNTIDGTVVAKHSELIETITLMDGFAEQDPEKIWDSVVACIDNVLDQFLSQSKSNTLNNIKAVGITDQRETTVCWNKTTGKPYYNALVWHDKRNDKIVEKLIEDHDGMFSLAKYTGLPFSNYFSCTKIKWILNYSKEFQNDQKIGNSCFGTIDTWLIWKLTESKYHLTDVTNASRTSLFNINIFDWDRKLCSAFGVPITILPTVKESYADFGTISFGRLKGIPIKAVFGDQSAALYGQDCLDKGSAKMTFGTGAFFLCNVGNSFNFKNNGMLYTVASAIDNEKVYAMESSICCAGKAVEWVVNKFNLESPLHFEQLAKSVEDTNGVYFVTTFSGFFTPHWDPNIRASIYGMNLNTSKAHIARACLESIAFATADSLKLMDDYGVKVNILRVDGGMCVNETFLQMLSDLTGIDIEASTNNESTVYGVARLASKSCKNMMPGIGASGAVVYTPKMSENVRMQKIQKWRNAVELTLNFKV